MKKILLTGGNGFLGNHVWEELNNDFELIRFSSKELDLTNKSKTFQFFRRHSPDIVIHMAARLGGIGDNISNPLAYYETNLSIGVNVLEACKKINIEHLINVGTVCSYPKSPSIPFKEEDLWNGIPEESNRYYGLSKRAIIDYCMALSQFGKIKITNLLMANLYGIGDDFREKTSHVIPALIKKIHILDKTQVLNVWGDGTPSRDFLNVKDAARVIGRITRKGYMNSFPINVGTGTETTINTLVKMILCHYSKDDIQVIHNINKPNGQPRRVLDISRLTTLYGIKPTIDIEDGIVELIKWYTSNISYLEGLADKYNS